LTYIQSKNEFHKVVDQFLYGFTMQIIHAFKGKETHSKTITHHNSLKHLYVEYIMKQNFFKIDINYNKIHKFLYTHPNYTNHHISLYLKDLLESFWSFFFSS
jgi:hypothetical protein